MSYRSEELVELCEAATGKKGRQNERGWMVVCPSHQDESPSLSISEGNKGLLLNCFQGCRVHEICGALGIKVNELFYDSDKPNYVKKTKYQREQFEIDTWTVWLYFSRKENSQIQTEDEYKSYREAEKRLRDHVAQETERANRKRYSGVFKKRRLY